LHFVPDDQENEKYLLAVGIFNSHEAAAEKNRRRLLPFTTVSPPFNATGEATKVMSFYFTHQ
jgi:hypothetical protein